MTATEILTSIDRQIKDATLAYEQEIADLKQKLVQAQADASAARDLMQREGAKASSAIQTAATLMAHFGAVGKLFEDAKLVAERAKALFADIESKAQTVEAKVVAPVETVGEKAVAAVDAALHNLMEPSANVQT